MWRRILIGCVIVVAIGFGGIELIAAPGAMLGGAPLMLSATPVPLNADDLAQTRVGRLRYLGGVVLKSPNPKFGGLSGLRVAPDGRALAISDTGNWVAFRIVERGGRLVGVTGGAIAPLLDIDGRPPIDKGSGDAEALEWNPATGEAAVSFEGDHRLQRYRGIDPGRPETLGHRPYGVTRTPATAAWPDNGGGEALAALPTGALLWFAEDRDQDDDGSPLLLVNGSVVRAQRFVPPDSFSPTDAAALPDGDVLVVSRRASPTQGFLAVVTQATPGDRMTGTEVARFAPPVTVDNIEGLSVVTSGGRTFVYLMSDDNFMRFQRTLLLKFELMDR